MKKIIIIVLLAIIGVVAYLFIANGPDEAKMKKNENIVRQYLINEEKVSSSDITRLKGTYHSREKTEKFQYMVEVELATESDVICLYIVDKGAVRLYGKVQK